MSLYQGTLWKCDCLECKKKKKNGKQDPGGEIVLHLYNGIFMESLHSENE